MLYSAKAEERHSVLTERKLLMADKVSLAWMGKSTPRVEDAQLLRGAGKFLDDVNIERALIASFVRSPIAHGTIKFIKVGAALALPGVHAVLVFSDLRPLLTHDRMPLDLPSGAIRFNVNPPVLAYDEVCYVGEPLAVVIAESRGIAEDAAALVEMEFDTLPPVLDPKESVANSAPKVRQECPDNLPARHSVKYGDSTAAFKAAKHHFKDSFRLHKGGGHSMEPRGVIARVDDNGVLTLWDSTQMPHRAKNILVEALGLTEEKVRVIAPDVGGGFGPKAVFHPEELAISAAAIKLGVPIKWVEDRFESFTASCHERLQVWDMEAAFDANGKLLAIRGCLYHDHGSSTPYGVPIPYNSATNLIGPYVLPAYDIDILLCMTNFVPSTPTRGAGRPQGTFVMERLLDRAADEIGIDRTEIRRRNLIQPHQMPYATPVVMRDGSYMTYDSGNYPECQRRALEHADFADFPRRQKEARAKGIFLGLGLCNYVEGTGRGPFESASLRIGASGKVIVTTGATAQGQGVKSMLAQITAGVLGLNPADIHVVEGDTNSSPLGLGAYASRQTVTAGNSMFAAANLVASKARAMASHMLEASPDDLELIGGKVCVKGVPGLQVSLGEVAKVLGGMPGYAIPGGMDPGLSASVDFPIGQLTFTNGSHVVEVSVDLDTALVKVLRYVVEHDCGNMINPMMVEGQVRGGVVHGIGMTLFECMRYDEQGQPTSVTYADYLLPTCDVVPSIEIHHLISPSPLNPLGVKGAAESGTIGAASAIASAIENALHPLSIRIVDLPITPAKLRGLIATAQRVA
jgi:carbon-monoxide dehydrogenase large subunit